MTEEDRQEFLSVGPPSDRLFKQGKCQLCKIPLFGLEPKKRTYCGTCRQSLLNPSDRMYTEKADDKQSQYGR